MHEYISIATFSEKKKRAVEARFSGYAIALLVGLNGPKLDTLRYFPFEKRINEPFLSLNVLLSSANDAWIARNLGNDGMRK